MRCTTVQQSVLLSILFEKFVLERLLGLLVPHLGSRPFYAIFTCSAGRARAPIRIIYNNIRLDIRLVFKALEHCNTRANGY